MFYYGNNSNADSQSPYDNNTMNSNSNLSNNNQQSNNNNNTTVETSFESVWNTCFVANGRAMAELNSAHQRELALLRAQLEGSQHEISSLKSQMVDSTNSSIKENYKTRSRDELIRTLNHEIDSKSNDNHALRSEIASKNKQMEELATKYKEVMDELDQDRFSSTTATTRGLKPSNNQQDLERISLLESENEQLRNEIKTKDDIILELNDRITALNTVNDEFSTKNTELKAEIQSKYKKLHELKTYVEQMNSERIELQDRKELETTLKSVQTENKNLKSGIKTKDLKLTELDYRVKRLASDNEGLKAKLEEVSRARRGASKLNKVIASNPAATGSSREGRTSVDSSDEYRRQRSGSTASSVSSSSSVGSNEIMKSAKPRDSTSTPSRQELVSAKRSFPSPPTSPDEADTSRRSMDTRPSPQDYTRIHNEGKSVKSKTIQKKKSSIQSLSLSIYESTKANIENSKAHNPATAAVKKAHRSQSQPMIGLSATDDVQEDIITVERRRSMEIEKISSRKVQKAATFSNDTTTSGSSSGGFGSSASKFVRRRASVDTTASKKSNSSFNMLKSFGGSFGKKKKNRNALSDDLFNTPKNDETTTTTSIVSEGGVSNNQNGVDDRGDKNHIENGFDSEKQQQQKQQQQQQQQHAVKVMEKKETSEKVSKFLGMVNNLAGRKGQPSFKYHLLKFVWFETKNNEDIVIGEHDIDATLVYSNGKFYIEDIKSEYHERIENTIVEYAALNSVPVIIFKQTTGGNRKVLCLSSEDISELVSDVGFFSNAQKITEMTVDDLEKYSRWLKPFQKSPIFALNCLSPKSYGTLSTTTTTTLEEQLVSQKQLKDQSIAHGSNYNNGNGGEGSSSSSSLGRNGRRKSQDSVGSNLSARRKLF